MSDAVQSENTSAETPADESSEDFGHPRGTLAIVIIYALIFALSWGGLYVWHFLGRGAPTP